MEPLELRLAPAVLGLDIRLLSDIDGSPGAPLSEARDLIHGPVEEGQIFWVEVLAWDDRAAGEASG